MWIDYVIGIASAMVVILVVSKFICNYKNKKNSRSSCSGNCIHCTHRANYKFEKK